jgi:hypothetical protein
MSMSHIWQNAERENAELRARVAELEAQHDAAADLFASGRRYERAWCAVGKGMGIAALATLERVREALTRSGDEPAIDTLARIEAALR